MNLANHVMMDLIIFLKERYNKSEGKYTPSVCRILEAQGGPFLYLRAHAQLHYVSEVSPDISNKQKIQNTPKNQSLPPEGKYKNMSG